MARVATEDLSPEATAAYPESQPLYDALNAACDTKIDAQKAHLLVSRSHVRHQNVANRLPPQSAFFIDHDRWINGIMKAWREVMDAYLPLFEQLVALTEIDTDKRIPWSRGHAEFETILDLLREGKAAGTRYMLSEELEEMRPTKKRAPPNRRDGGLGQKYGGNVVGAAGSSATKLPTRKRPTAEPESTNGDMTSSGKNARRKLNHPAFVDAEPEEPPTKAGVGLEVQYEDVSAEAARRRKEKETAKAAREAEKASRTKRKRQSAGSVVTNDEPSIAELAAEDKPKKKKSRRTDNDEPKKEKRRNTGDSVEALDDAKSVKKKRVKA